MFLRKREIQFLPEITQFCVKFGLKLSQSIYLSNLRYFFLVKIEFLLTFKNIFREDQHQLKCTKYNILGENRNKSQFQQNLTTILNLKICIPL